MFLCFTLNHEKDVFLFSILKLFTLCCKEQTLCNRWFSPGFTFSLWTPLILEETDLSSFVSFSAKASGFQLFSFITFQNIMLNFSSTHQDLCSFLILFSSRQTLDCPSSLSYVSSSVTLITVIQCIDRVIEILHRPPCLDLWCCAHSDTHLIS